jgi:hypothetical protein
MISPGHELRVYEFAGARRKVGQPKHGSLNRKDSLSAQQMKSNRLMLIWMAAPGL